jgi:HAD superfamily hydrolase (TIGR01509 family)
VTRDRATAAALLQAAADIEHVRLVRRLTMPSLSKPQLGLPLTVEACVFDLDGVLAASADVHFAAWAETFDEFLSRRFEDASVHFSHCERLSRRVDYEAYLAGRTRLDGVRAFLASRGIKLPEGEEDDRPGTATVHGLANRKREALRGRLEHEGMNAYAGSYRYLEAAAGAGLLCAVVSASTNTAAIVERAGLIDLVDVVVDGYAMSAGGLRAKPEPDTLIAACAELAVEPRNAAAFETTPAGIAAARRAGFAVAVAVDRTGGAGALRTAGADVVVSDLAGLLLGRDQ